MSAEKKPDKAPTPQKTKRQGSGQEVVVGSGKDPIGITHPGADSTPVPGTPGQIIFGDEPIVINAGRDVVTLRVENMADRSVTVGSHYHFAEANPALEFDRAAAWGRRLNIMSGSMTRFEPGAVQEVELVPFAGRRIMAGFRGESRGAHDD